MPRNPQFNPHRDAQADDGLVAVAYSSMDDARLVELAQSHGIRANARWKRETVLAKIEEYHHG